MNLSVHPLRGVPLPFPLCQPLHARFRLSPVSASIALTLALLREIVSPFSLAACHLHINYTLTIDLLGLSRNFGSCATFVTIDPSPLIQGVNHLAEPHLDPS